MIVQEYVPLAPFTTFGIGGNARYFIACTSITDIHEALAYCREKALPCVVLSGGSNVLIADEGFDGCVIHIKNQGSNRLGNTVVIEAGCSLLESIERCHEYNLGGWESLSGIPGSIGGAIRGNVGAFGSEIQEYCTEVRTCHSETGEEKIFIAAECDFSYRSSFFKEHPEWIILSGTLNLKQGGPEAIAKISQTITEREKRHLQNVPCAGSYFMNPVAPQWVQDIFAEEKGTEAREGRVPAGWLIEKVGMRGYKQGNAASSEMHANYLINTGNATAADVRAVAAAIQDAVRAKYIVSLREEPTLIGFEQ